MSDIASYGWAFFGFGCLFVAFRIADKLLDSFKKKKEDDDPNRHLCHCSLCEAERKENENET